MLEGIVTREDASKKEQYTGIHIYMRRLLYVNFILLPRYATTQVEKFVIRPRPATPYFFILPSFRGSQSTPQH